MKRALCMAACLLIAVTANAQIRAHSSEQYNQHTDVLQAKSWASSQGHFRSDNQDDGKMINIYRADSAKFYLIFPDKKMYMILPRAQMNTNGMMGFELETSRNTQVKFIGMEEVETRMCRHQRSTTTSTLSTGVSETRSTDYWVWEPINTSILVNPGMGLDGAPTISRNIQIGEQPAHLFDLSVNIPKDYTQMVIPAGGLNDAMKSATGMSVSDLKGLFDNLNKDAKSQLEKLNELQNDKTLTDEQKLQNALKMMEEMSKKK